MTARLTHEQWVSRNPVADMPPDVLARVRASEPKATPPTMRYPIWWQAAYACFCDCSTERSIGFGIGPIPSGAIRAWLAWKQIPEPTLTMLHDIVRRMDAKYLELEAARAKEK